jgi:SAM-dependent methyltransferase
MSIASGVKAALPRRVGESLHAARDAAFGAVYRGDRLHCTVCGGTFRRFLGVGARPEGRCPGCGSVERHRLAALVLREHTSLFTRPTRLLHFAPERGLSRIIRHAPTVEYVTADITPGKADRVLDITDIDCPDDSFDAVICSHVLEHIPDDLKAMRELRRVLRPGAWAFLVVPFDPKLTETYEDATITSPEAREKAFGQWDHVRWYAGTDFDSRLREAGFTVDAVEIPHEQQIRCQLSGPNVADWAVLAR